MHAGVWGRKRQNIRKLLRASICNPMFIQRLERKYGKILLCDRMHGPYESRRDWFLQNSDERRARSTKRVAELHQRRTDEDRSKPWTPSAYDRVCSAHFLTGTPHYSSRHPDYKPQLKMGYPQPADLETKLLSSLKRYERQAQREQVNVTAYVIGESSSTDTSGVEHDAETVEEMVVQECSTDNPLDKNTQTDDRACCDSSERCRQLEEENRLLKQEIKQQKERTLAFNNLFVKVSGERDQLQKSISKTKLSVTNLDQKQLKYFTGIRSHQLFTWIVSLVSRRKFPTLCKTLDIPDKVLLILMKLRLGLQNKDLAYRFGISENQVTGIFRHGVQSLAKALRFLIVWPEKGAIIRNVPKAFKRGKTYRNTRVIIDCSEVFIQRPSNLLARNITYSNYKHHNTIKVLVGITPTGAVSFLSRCWGGRVSDKELTINSGFLEKLEHGDQVMADRGFLIKEEVLCRGAALVIPSFTKGKNQLKRTEVITSRKIANVRIHVERAIGRMKKFRILNTTWDLELVKSCNDIFVIIGALVNLLPPLVR